MAGGTWDNLDHRFLDPATEHEPEKSAVIELEESQVPYTLWFAEQLADFREGYPRDISLALVAGDRRAGKTFDAYACQIAALIDVPLLPTTGLPAIGWTVSKTFRERAELDDLITGYVPAHFYKHQRAPDHRYTFVHGSILRNLSADDPDSLKQGRVDWLLYNEPQKMQARGIVNGLYGTSDQGGLCTLAANPPTPADTRGEWLFDLKEAIDDEMKSQANRRRREPLGAVYFNFSSKDNTKIDQPARKRVGRLATIIDPTNSSAEGNGEWRRPGDKACWEFDRYRHVHAVPDVAPGLRDVTRELVRERAEWGDWNFVAGVDFDFRPHIVAVIYRVFGSIDDPLFWAVDEFAGERSWTVKRWIEEFAGWGEERGFTPGTLLMVGDASSGWPGRDSDPKLEQDRNAFETIEGAGWTIVPPQDHRGKTGRARNPFVDERLDLLNEQLRRDRLRLDPKRCSWLVECARQATTERKTGRRKLKHDKYAHAIDAASYPIWRLAPRASAPDRGGPPMVSVPVRRFGDDF
jgi:hypothetical protein